MKLGMNNAEDVYCFMSAGLAWTATLYHTSITKVSDLIAYDGRVSLDRLRNDIREVRELRLEHLRMIPSRFRSPEEIGQRLLYGDIKGGGGDMKPWSHRIPVPPVYFIVGPHTGKTVVRWFDKRPTDAQEKWLDREIVGALDCSFPPLARETVLRELKVLRINRIKDRLSADCMREMAWRRTLLEELDARYGDPAFCGKEEA
jgi:hypothetical protein